MVAVEWQLESSEVTVDVGCQGGMQPGCQLECLLLDSACGLELHGLVAGLERGCPKGVSPFAYETQAEAARLLMT